MKTRKQMIEQVLENQRNRHDVCNGVTCFECPVTQECDNDDFCNDDCYDDILTALGYKKQWTTEEIKKLKLQIHTPDEACFNRLMDMLKEQGFTRRCGKWLPFDYFFCYATLDGMSRSLFSMNSTQSGDYEQLSVRQYKEKYYDNWQKEPKMKNYIVFKTNERCLIEDRVFTTPVFGFDWEKSNLKPNTTYVLWMLSNLTGVFKAVPNDWEITDCETASASQKCKYLNTYKEWEDCSGAIVAGRTIFIIPKTSPEKQALLDRMEALENKAKELDAERDALKREIESK